MPAPLQYTVTITKEDIYAADAKHLNGRTIAAIIRDELQNCGKHYQDDDWHYRLFRHVVIKAEKVVKTEKVEKVETKLGEHYWALMGDKLVVVAKTTHGKNEVYEVWGSWEGIVNPDKLEIISVIEKPKGHENTSLYYDSRY